MNFIHYTNFITANTIQKNKNHMLGKGVFNFSLGWEFAMFCSKLSFLDNLLHPGNLSTVAQEGLCS